MWECPKCHESVEDTFGVCWNCGTSKDGVEDPNFEPVGEVTPAPRTPVDLHVQEQAMQFTCFKCGSNRVVPAVRILDANGEFGTADLKAKLDRHPTAWIFKDAEVSVLQARICGECGYTEIYATHPEAIWSAFTERRDA